MERYAHQIVQLLNPILPEPVSEKDLDLPPDLALGDFAFPCFKLAKTFQKSPPQVALTLLEELKVRHQGTVIGDLEVQTAGPYLNFKVRPETATKALLKDLLEGEDLGAYGARPEKSRETWVIEYSSPNVAKSFHVGHLRTTALGAALDRVGRYRGFKMISINHLGDHGTQFGKLAVAFQRYGKDLPTHPTIDDLVKIYVKFHEDAEKHPELEDEAREAFRKIEEGDPKYHGLWKKAVEISMKEFNRLYDLFNVKFDYIRGETYYTPMLKDLIHGFQKKGIAEESEGALVVFVTDEKGKEIPPCILQKKDGASIYATRDLAAAINRYEEFQFDRMSYVVGDTQKLHFQQVFGTLKKAGYRWVDRCEHIPFGLYRFNDEKMSTRKGNVVTLNQLLEACKVSVREVMSQREADQDLSSEEKEKIIEQVAIGAILFFDLSTDPIKNVQFELSRATSFEGETGPYLQYAHTRCLSILRKAYDQEVLKKTPAFDSHLAARLTDPREVALVKLLGRFPYTLERTLQLAKANQLCNYLIDVAKAFGTFYKDCRVLSEDKELSQARLLLIEATRRVLGQGLTLLGIPLPDKM